MDAIPSDGVDATGLTDGTVKVIDWSPAVDKGSIRDYAFYRCSAITTLTLPPGMTGSIGTYAFYNCSALMSIVIQSPTMVTLANVSAFTGTTCNVYVPDALVATYQAATNWSTLADRIKPISELP